MDIEGFVSGSFSSLGMKEVKFNGVLSFNSTRRGYSNSRPDVELVPGGEVKERTNNKLQAASLFIILRCRV
jgi:hypothetical protein